MQDTIGIDVSKGTLDLHRRVDGANIQFSNDTPGFKHLLKWIGPCAPALIVFEGQTMGLAGPIIAVWKSF